MSESDWASLPWPRTLFVSAGGYPTMRVFCPEIRREEDVSLHRWVLNNPLDLVVDHINRNRCDVRRENLRPATYSQNARNRSPIRDKASKFKGVTWNKGRGKWEARITLADEFYSNGRNKVRFLGYYTCDAEAAMAYNKEAAGLCGEHAYLNICG
jgi:hypothetical protein